MIVISGSTSFIGKSIIKILKELNISYRVISRFEIYSDLERLLTSIDCSIFIHCAWSMNYDLPYSGKENNTLNKAVLDATKKVSHFIFMSSIYVMMNDGYYAQDKRKWERRFVDSASENKNKVSTIFLPHLIAPEVGLNNNSVVYKFYNNWKLGLPLKIYNDIDIPYTDFKSFREVFVQILTIQDLSKVVPKFYIASVSRIKEEFLAENALCPIINQLKKSNI